MMVINMGVGVCKMQPKGVSSELPDLEIYVG